VLGFQRKCFATVAKLVFRDQLHDVAEPPWQLCLLSEDGIVPETKST
jgi:hypothetical protein